MIGSLIWDFQCTSTIVIINFFRIGGSILLVILYQFFKKKGKNPSKHKHGPDCDHEPEKPFGQSRSRLPKGKYSGGESLDSQFDLNDIGSLKGNFIWYIWWVVKMSFVVLKEWNQRWLQRAKRKRLSLMKMKLMIMVIVRKILLWGKEDSRKQIVYKL